MPVDPNPHSTLPSKTLVETLGIPVERGGHAVTGIDTPRHGLSRPATSGHAVSRSVAAQDPGAGAGTTPLPIPAKARSNGGAALDQSGDTGRAASTLTQYETRFRQLQAHFERDQGCVAGEVPEAFVTWLLNRQNLRPASRRLYHAALRHGLGLARDATTEPGADARIAAALARLDGYLPGVSEPVDRAKPAPPKTSARKLKRLTADLIGQMSTALARGGGRYDAALGALWRAGLVAGLRPCEWRRARLWIEPDRAVLVVANAKTTKGRAHGPFRRLVWDDPDCPDVAAIAVWLRILRGPDGRSRRDQATFDSFIKALRNRIRAVAQALWPRRRSRPTLYSCRHFFSAIAKQSRRTVEVAALMGHAHDATAMSHYARPARGGGGRLPDQTVPRPHPRDIARVRAVYAERRAFLDEKIQAAHAPQA